MVFVGYLIWLSDVCWFCLCFVGLGDVGFVWLLVLFDWLFVWLVFLIVGLWWFDYYEGWWLDGLGVCWLGVWV